MITCCMDIARPCHPFGLVLEASSEFTQKLEISGHTCWVCTSAYMELSTREQPLKLDFDKHHSICSFNVSRTLLIYSRKIKLLQNCFFAGLIFFLGLGTMTMLRPNVSFMAPMQEKVVFGVYFLGAVLCLFFSWLFHTVYCHSEKVSRTFSK